MSVEFYTLDGELYKKYNGGRWFKLTYWDRMDEFYWQEAPAHFQLERYDEKLGVNKAYEYKKKLKMIKELSK